MTRTSSYFKSSKHLFFLFCYSLLSRDNFLLVFLSFSSSSCCFIFFLLPLRQGIKKKKKVQLTNINAGRVWVFFSFIFLILRLSTSSTHPNSRWTDLGHRPPNEKKEKKKKKRYPSSRTQSGTSSSSAYSFPLFTSFFSLLACFFLLTSLPRPTALLLLPPLSLALLSLYLNLSLSLSLSLLFFSLFSRSFILSLSLPLFCLLRRPRTSTSLAMDNPPPNGGSAGNSSDFVSVM